MCPAQQKNRKKGGIRKETGQELVAGEVFGCRRGKGMSQGWHTGIWLGMGTLAPGMLAKDQAVAGWR